MRAIASTDERQMIREKTGWECCDLCDSPIACAKDYCCARRGDEGSPSELSALADKYEAGLAKMIASGYEEFGHDAPRNHRLVIEALRKAAATQPGWNSLLSREEVVEYLRKENYEAEIIGIIDNFPPAAVATGQIFNALIERVKYDGDDFASLTLGEVARAIEGAVLTGAAP